jgi:hypothetical protein
MKVGDMVWSKNDWEKGQIGLITKIEKRARGRGLPDSGFDRVYVIWTNEGYSDVYMSFYLQVINQPQINVEDYDEEQMWRMWGDQ